MTQYLPSIAAVALISFVITRILIPVSHTVGLLDHPGQRKTHSGSIPLVGGIAIYLSVTLCSVVFLDLPEHFIGMALICGLVTLMGALDDRFPVHPVYRLIIQLMAGLSIASIGNVSLENLGNLFSFGDARLGLLAIPISALGIAGLCNAYNMTDGIDGLAGSLALVAMISLLSLTWNHAPENEVALLAFFCAAITVFLLFNLTVRPFSSTKIFMGDAGSMFLGMAIAIAMIYFSQSEREIINPVTTLWLVAIPMMDMVSTMLRRILKRKSPFHADRTHLHHILMRAGMSQQQALFCIISSAVFFAAVGIFLERIWPQNEAISFALFLVVFGLYFNFVVKHAWKFAVNIRSISNKVS